MATWIVKSLPSGRTAVCGYPRENPGRRPKDRAASRRAETDNVGGSKKHHLHLAFFTYFIEGFHVLRHYRPEFIIFHAVFMQCSCHLNLQWTRKRSETCGTN